VKGIKQTNSEVYSVSSSAGEQELLRAKNQLLLET